jgi:hypothetical protein
VNQSTPGRPTALHIAAWNGDAEMMALLLAAGGNFKGRPSQGDGFLVQAIKRANPEILSLIRSTLHNSRNPVALLGVNAYIDLLNAVRRSDLKMLRQLLALGVPADIAFVGWPWVLHAALPRMGKTSIYFLPVWLDTIIIERILGKPKMACLCR